MASRKRRRLRFRAVDEVMPEVDRLLRGHEVVGRWSLAEVCNHLATAFRLSVDGVPWLAPWAVRRTVGRVSGWFVLASGWMPRGVPLPGIEAPGLGLDAAREAEGLRAAIERYLKYEGELSEHPVFGRLSRRGAERFHCVHCAHHLSFVVPAGST
jgi:hypothetical protein